MLACSFMSSILTGTGFSTLIIHHLSSSKDSSDSFQAWHCCCTQSTLTLTLKNPSSVPPITCLFISIDFCMFSSNWRLHFQHLLNCMDLAAHSNRPKSLSNLDRVTVASLII